MSTSNSACEEADGFSPLAAATKKKRGLPGHPDPNAEVIALSPRSLLATSRFICEICNKGFQRDQNLQLHRRGHNLPWKLKQKSSLQIRKKVYVCPELTCVHHNPARALGDLTGIKKHFSRKHGERKWKCDRCSKHYAVQSDWKAHRKTCGTREYHCDCGNVFSRRDSFITHKAFCDALAEENGSTSTRSRQEENQETQPLLSHNHANAYIRFFKNDMRVPLSPTSQIIRDDVVNSKTSMPLSHDRMTSDFSFGLQDGTVMTKWVDAFQKNELTTSTSKGPGLSLSLGISAGPGLLYSFQEMMTDIDASGSLELPSLKSLHKLPFPQNYNLPRPCISAMSMLSTLFSSPKHGSTRRDSANGMLGSLEYGSSINEPDVTATQLHMSQSPKLSASISSIMSGRETVATGSYQQVSSATALLQKAAQMGATASKPSFLQKFGTQVGDVVSTQEMPKQSSSWIAVDSMYSRSASRLERGGELLTHKARCESAKGQETSVISADSARSSLSSVSIVVPQPVHAGQKRDHEGHTTMVDFLGVGEVSDCQNHDEKKLFSSQ